MNKEQNNNPAEIAAQKALDEMFECINKHQNFRLEAGAGAGKTYSLVHALQMIIREQGATLQRNSQRIACITYTNVATDEIISRTDSNPVVSASTIHSFCWDLIKGFQPFLRDEVSKISYWKAQLVDTDGIGQRIVDYDLGYHHINDTHLYLHHDEVLALTVALMNHGKFRQILTARFPILFIDEYQDTNIDFADSIIQHFIAPNTGPLIGLFGDSWQKIYRDGKGSIEHANLKEIGKEANFRSVIDIVGPLNRIRPNLPQEVKDPNMSGSVVIYHSNNWDGDRRTGNHWKDDLPAMVAHRYREELCRSLTEEGWDFSYEKTKILMLTHNALATEQNYSQIVSTFKYNDSFLKKEDPHIAFLVDTVELACSAFENGKYGEMFSAIGSRADLIKAHSDKKEWTKDMKTLIELRNTGTIGEVIDLLKKTKRPRLPRKVQKTEEKLVTATAEEIDGSLTLSQIHDLRDIPYREIISLALFVNNHTPFSTKHGVKGAEFENVLAVFGRGWNQYNWDQFLDWFPDSYPAEKVSTYERNRNLFYVVCSRPKKRLALLFTQKLSEQSLSTLRSIFGNDNVKPLPVTL